MSRKKVASWQPQPKFFKFMIDDFNHMLQIPPAFEEYMNGEPRKEVMLVGPTDRCFKVAANRDDGGLFLQKGWHDFVDYHSLQLGELLVFSYDGKSRFDVEIFDVTACEKEEKLYIMNPEDASNGLGKQSKVSKHGVMSSRAPEAAKAFKKTHRSFTNTIKPSHINFGKGYMSIPRLFAKENGFCGTFTMNLRGEGDEKIWSVKVFHRPGDGRVEIRTGWKIFCDDNNLKEGDVCRFELLQEVPVRLMKVSIIRLVEKNCTAKH